VITDQWSHTMASNDTLWTAWHHGREKRAGGRSINEQRLGKMCVCVPTRSPHTLVTRGDEGRSGAAAGTGRPHHTVHTAQPYECDHKWVLIMNADTPMHAAGWEVTRDGESEERERHGEEREGERERGRERRGEGVCSHIVPKKYGHNRTEQNFF
jgi:hypothetical protein